MTQKAGSVSKSQNPLFYSQNSVKRQGGQRYRFLQTIAANKKNWLITPIINQFVRATVRRSESSRCAANTFCILRHFRPLNQEKLLKPLSFSRVCPCFFGKPPGKNLRGDLEKYAHHRSKLAVCPESILVLLQSFTDYTKGEDVKWILNALYLQ